jgi:hypothetical protein
MIPSFNSFYYIELSLTPSFNTLEIKIYKYQHIPIPLHNNSNLHNGEASDQLKMYIKCIVDQSGFSWLKFPIFFNTFILILFPQLSQKQKHKMFGH